MGRVEKGGKRKDNVLRFEDWIESVGEIETVVVVVIDFCGLWTVVIATVLVFVVGHAHKVFALKGRCDSAFETSEGV